MLEADGLSQGKDGPNMGSRQNGPEGSVEMATMLAMASKALADLVAKVRTATADEMPALAMEATISIDRIVRCCIEPTFAQRLGPTSSMEEMVADLISLGEALQTEIARLFALRFAQLA